MSCIPNQSPKLFYLDPCAHNRCGSGSVCVRNLESAFGYDCICQWPTTADPNVYGEGKKPIGLAGLDFENGCKAVDFRNVDGNFKGTFIVDHSIWWMVLVMFDLL